MDSGKVIDEAALVALYERLRALDPSLFLEYFEALQRVVLLREQQRMIETAMPTRLRQPKPVA
jgi:hypothetical protein